MLAFEREGLAGGQAWRLATGFLAHWSPWHAAANAIAVGVLGLVIARQEGLGNLVRIALAALVAQALALVYLSDASEYRGASGFAYALGAFILMRSITRSPLRASVMAAASLAYVGSSAALASPWLPQDIKPDLAVHLAGALAGSLAAICSRSARLRA